MKLVYFLVRFIVQLFYYPFCLCKVQTKKVTFLSRQTNEPSIDFKYIQDELIKHNFKTVMLCKRFDNIKRHLFSYSIFTIKSIYHIATSRVCIVDSYSVVSMLKKRKNTYVMQIWHALGAIKKFSYQTLDTPYGRSKKAALSLRMHKGYDMILSTSKKTTEYFMEAFRYPYEKFYQSGLPRIDYLKKEEKRIKKDILNKYPELKDKKNILYVPTFRNKENNINSLTKQIDFKKYNFIVKSHSNQHLNTNNSLIFTCDDVKSIDLLTISDYVITDYSAIALEAMILKKKVFYYLYDYEEYQKNNGLNVDLFKEMPNCCFKKSKDLIKALDKKYPWKEWHRYYNLYLEQDKGDSTKKIVDKIILWSSDTNEKS